MAKLLLDNGLAGCKIWLILGCMGIPGIGWQQDGKGLKDK
jgi:hypothetical protein